MGSSVIQIGESKSISRIQLTVLGTISMIFPVWSIYLCEIYQKWLSLHYVVIIREYVKKCIDCEFRIPMTVNEMDSFFAPMVSALERDFTVYHFWLDGWIKS